MYVSNSEDSSPDGGVGSLTFNSDGEVINYEKIVTLAEWNCGGGATSKHSQNCTLMILPLLCYIILTLTYSLTLSNMNIYIYIYIHIYRQDVLGNMGNM